MQTREHIYNVLFIWIKRWLFRGQGSKGEWSFCHIIWKGQTMDLSSVVDVKQVEISVTQDTPSYVHTLNRNMTLLLQDTITLMNIAQQFTCFTYTLLTNSAYHPFVGLMQKHIL